MKTLKDILTLVMVTAFIFSCKNETAPEVKTVETDMAVKAEKY